MKSGCIYLCMYIKDGVFKKVEIKNKIWKYNKCRRVGECDGCLLNKLVYI